MARRLEDRQDGFAQQRGLEGIAVNIEKFSRDWQQLSLHEAITSMGNPYTSEQASMAYSFCNFLADTYGETGFATMYPTVTLSNYRESLTTYTEKSVDELNEEWMLILLRTEVSEEAEKRFRQ
jgi:hypothetical protein